MFHYVDPNEENMTKREVIKKLVKSNKMDRGLGSTVPVAESIDALLKVCEDIETQGTIVLKSVDQSLIKGSHVAQESMNRFYTLIRQGIKQVTNTNFKNVPRMDIKNLTDYRDTLSVLYTSLNDSFEALNNELYGNQPLKGRTYAQYEQEEGTPYRPPIALSELDKYMKNKEKLENEIDKLGVIFQSIEQTINDKSELLRVQEEQRKYISASYFQNIENEAIETNSKRKAELERLIEGQRVSLQKITNSIKKLEQEILQIQAQQQVLPNEIEKLIIKKQQLETSPLGVYLNNSAPLTEQERALRKQYEKNTELVAKDYGLVMKDFNIFINTLNHGLISNTTGISGKLSKSQEVNYRTPSQTALTNLTGSGQIHKRFL